MSETRPQPNGDDDDGITLSPDAPIGEPVPASPEPAPQPALGDGGIIGPGDAPGTR